MEQRDLIAKLTGHLMKLRDEHAPRLPSERDLSEYFGVSRGQIREALAILEALRIVERKAKSGIYLTENRSSIEALALFAQAGLPLSSDEVYQAVEMRKIHEITAIRLACERATLGNFDSLRAVLTRSQERIDKGEPINIEDRDFHLEIVRATQNNVFHKIVSVFYLMSEHRLPLYFANAKRSRRSHEEHLRIYDALAKRDAAAAMALMSAHLKGVESYWNDLIGGSDRAAAAQ